jgi:predicted MFS family arabinose efflux permease
MQTREDLPWGGLLALATAAFLTMLTETVPAGLLIQISSGLSVSEGQAGQLLTVYTGGAMLAAIPLVAATRGLARRPVLLATILVVAVANIATAVSSSYEVLLVARLIGGAAAGMQWAMIAGYAMRMVSEASKGRALAVSMAGVPLALAFGLPLGTFVGDLIGWRYTFAAMAALAILVMVWVVTTVPRFPGEPAHDRIPVRNVLVLPGIAVILVAAFAFEVGHMNLYTYVAPFLDRAGLGNHVGEMLLVFGVAAVAGLWAAGMLIDKNLRAVVLGSLAMFAVCMIAFGVAGRNPMVVIGTVALWGFTLGMAPTMFQAASAKAAGPATDVAQSMLVTVLNAGMSGGALTGGIALESAGVDSLAWISFAIFAATLLLAVLARRNAFPPPRLRPDGEHIVDPTHEPIKERT